MLLLFLFFSILIYQLSINFNKIITIIIQVFLNLKINLKN